MMNFNAARDWLKSHACPDCRGLGKQNDLEPGDISYNEWKCPPCKGTGWLKGKIPFKIEKKK